MHEKCASIQGAHFLTCNVFIHSPIQSIMKPTLFFFLFALFLHANETKAQSRYRIYFLINVFGCNSCNQISKDLKSYPPLLNEGTFLFSPEDVTGEQANGYIEDMFGTRFRVQINEEIYSKISKQIDFFKVPKIAVYDSIEKKCVQLFPMENIWYYKDVLDYYLKIDKPYRMRKIKQPRLSRLIGWKNINKVGDKFFVNSYNNNNKTYIYDLKTTQLDSLFISDQVLKKLYEIGGIKNVDVKELKAYHKLHDLPMQLVQFHSDPCSDNRYYNTYLNVFYYDPLYTGDTLSAQGFSFFVNYDVEKRNLKLQEFEFWESTPPADPYAYHEPSKYSQDWGYKKKLNDSTWIVSGDKLPDEGKQFSKTKLLLKFIKSKDTTYTKWVYSGQYDSLYVDSIFSYKGESMNEQASYYTFGYEPPYLFFCESPVIKDFEKDRIINMSDYDKSIDWTFNIEFTANLLHVIVQKNRKGIFRYTFNRADYTLIGSETVLVNKESGMLSTWDQIRSGGSLEDMNYQSNLLVDKGQLYYMHKNGDIVLFEK